jgi:hypothetical protein
LVNRRDFLLLRVDGASRSIVLSCEQLYMRYVDSRVDGTTAQLFQHLADDLRKVSAVRLTDTSWLSRDDLRQRVDGVLDGFRRRGGRIEP